MTPPKTSNRKPKMLPFTIRDFERMFPDDATCLEWMKDWLYPNGIFCVPCKRITKHHRITTRMSYSCDFCGHHVYPMAGTLTEKTRTPLRLWFYAIYLMSATRCGISAKQIQRETGVTYKTAWRMFKQIRTMLNDETPLGGVGEKVEMDEASIGSFTTRKYKVPNPRATVFGMVERHGRVKAVVAADRKMTTLKPVIKEYVLPRSVVFTDDFPSYDDLNPNWYKHRRINHSAGVYVMGSKHTQTIEGFWSLIKNSLTGVYHSVSHKYLQSYLNEFSFRYNHRHDTKPMFVSFLEQIASSRPSLPPVSEGNTSSANQSDRAA